MAYEDCGETAASLYEKDVKLFILLGFAYITQQCLGTIVISIVIFNWP